jgi:RecB family exonuclease
MSAITNNGAPPYKLSNSEIQTYKDCKRKWWLAYYRRLQPQAKRYTGPLALGSRIHNSLELYYTTDTPLLDAHADLVTKDRIEMLMETGDSTELDNEAELGRIMLEGYLEWIEDEGIDAELEFISAEEIISMPLFDGTVELQGKLDMRVRRKSDGVRLFRDFKTVGGSFTQYASTAHMNEQILTYMLLESAQNKEGERSGGGIFTLLKKVKRSAKAQPPFYDQFEVRHNVFALRTFWQRIHGAIADLMGTKRALDEGADPNNVAYPRPSGDCRWKCQFFAICPLFDDGSAVENAIVDNYVVSDPYDYYKSNLEIKGSE